MSATSSSPDEARRGVAATAHRGDVVSIESPLADEARRLLDASRVADVPLKLLGGMGIKLLLGERMDPRFHRPIDDLDFITTRKAARAVEKMLQTAGWEPERRFNTLNGARRLLFSHRSGAHKVDVFVGTFEMCHALPLAERIELQADTLPAAELLMSKLQIVSLNEKDRDDIYALLDALQVAEHDQDAINAARIAQLTGSDWGLHHTFELNLARLAEQAQTASLPDAIASRVSDRIEALSCALEAAPKSRGWRMRAKIGERKRWYEEPEEIER